MTEHWKETHAKAMDADAALITVALAALDELETRFGDIDPMVVEARQLAGLLRQRRNDAQTAARQLRANPPKTVMQTVQWHREARG